ncbi:MAG: hypothetical protein ASARMPREDX12_008399 [Alectoria sarmentosa]|nr:MAG: hypothetical protein ASARMPREDX12_008399 [Alectoria sarmentosa]
MATYAWPITYAWPSTGRHRPEDAAEHAARLKTDFDLVSNTVNSLSNITLLPSVLESRILTGIRKGIVEARSKGCCPELSEIDTGIFSKVMLKNITQEAALEARDRIPLPQFHGLRESYNALYNKLAIQIPSTITTHQTVGASAVTEATSVVDLVNAARKINNETDSSGNSKKLVTIRQEEKAKDVNGEESGNESSEEEDSGMEESEDADDGQEVIENGNSESGDDCSGDSSGDDGSGSEESEEDCETDSDAGSDEEENQEIVREESVPNISRDGSGFSTTIDLKIEQQACVNQLERMTALQRSDCLSSSLKKFLGDQQRSSRSVHISSVNLLDNGDVRVVIHAETREAIQKITDSTDWDIDFERTIVGSPVPTYNVRMNKVETKGLNFRNRKEKAAIITTLAAVNYATSHMASVKPTIKDIRWSQYPLPKVAATLIVEFLDPEQATQAVVLGLKWRGKRHGCEREDNKDGLLRCSRCQDYGHLFDKCSAPHRCGNCAGWHPTTTCKLKRRKCASCGGGHRAGKKSCPAKSKARKSIGFLKEIPSQGTKPAAEAQAVPSPDVRHSVSAARTQTETSMPSPVSLDNNFSENEIKPESDQSLPEADHTQDTYPDTATLLKQIEDLRKIVVARDAALQVESSGRIKRRAEEAFAGGADAESSNMAAKRIKQEQPTREDSMGLYRQPSPYIVNRSE